MKPGRDKRAGRKSAYCEAPGGGDDIKALNEKGPGWPVKEFPMRPGKLRPIVPAERGQGRS